MTMRPLITKALLRAIRTRAETLDAERRSERALNKRVSARKLRSVPAVVESPRRPEFISIVPPATAC